MTFSRRTFLSRLSAASLFPARHSWPSRLIKALLPGSYGAVAPFPAFSAHWSTVGRASLQRLKDSVILQDGFAQTTESWKDCEFHFRARAPQGTEQVQIWAGIRDRDRDSRYIFGLRGGNNDDVYLARYAPDGGARFLGLAPLGFHPQPGEWYTLRAVARGNRLQIYTNDDSMPRINVVDEEALWSEGGVSIGGGWLPVEFSDVRVQTLPGSAAAAFDALEDRAVSPASFNREAKRAEHRARYAPVRIEEFNAPRVEVSLDGRWLFMPLNGLAAKDKPEANGHDDANWHTMEVPHFWTPTLTWLHAETGFANLQGIAAGKGISDKLVEIELERLDSYTFDWKQTRAAWYRHYVDLPQDISGRRFQLCFDAIAKVAEVWVNGTRVGSHVGMFGEVRCDVTASIVPGRNLLAVYVVGSPEKPVPSTDALDVAVTVEVTSSMLNSLPHGMYPGNAAGIWQPVKFVITRNIAIDDVFIDPRLDGLDCELVISGLAASAATVEVSYTIRSTSDGSVLYASPAEDWKRLPDSGGVLRFSTPSLTPRHWSPAEPNLYHLEITLASGGEVYDQVTVPFGFRTFKVEGEKLLLNGEPFWLRGADHFPHALRPNDGRLARRFIQMAHEGNVQVTRTHTAPFTKTWLDAADEVGMAVSFEGTWPWLMLHGEPPSAELLHDWSQEFASLIRKYRNHPSILIWTVNNEMKFQSLDASKPELLKRKWTILDGMMKTIRSTDPTRPVICDSSYCRESVAKEYAELIRPAGFDDGDIDDSHRYYGWYDASFFHFFEGQFGKTQSWPDRPLISQEMSTGYPRNDDGHPTRYYIFKNYTPQSLVGAEAYENRDPAIFLKRQAFITKELAETIRRSNRENCAGILHFAYVSWFKNVWDADSIQPFETYHQLRKALAPVLVSAELYGRHVYSGSSLAFRVCIANDAVDHTSLPVSRLLWEISSSGKTIATGSQSVPPVPYYANCWVDVDAHIPVALPAPRVNATLTLRLQSNGVAVSENDYDIAIGSQNWALDGMRSAKGVALFDPGGHAPRMLKNGGVHQVASLDALERGQSLIVANAEIALTKSMNQIRSFVQNGGRVLLLDAGAILPAMFPEQIKSYRACEGEIVTMAVPESSVFSGIGPLDLSWFQLGAGTIPRACRGMYQIARTDRCVTALAETVEHHGFLQRPEDVVNVSGSPLVELRIGDGVLLASEMMLSASDNDPIAGRLLGNLVCKLCEMQGMMEGARDRH